MICYSYFLEKCWFTVACSCCIIVNKSQNDKKINKPYWGSVNCMKKTKRKVLIIEDNEINRELLTELLKDEYDVLTAENGEVGYDILTKHYRELSVIFLDMIMPVCDGYEFLSKIRNDAILNSVPVIVTTGSGSPEDETKCLELGDFQFRGFQLSLEYILT